MIDYLRGYNTAPEPIGWSGRRAELIALACLHSGSFTRVQETDCLSCGHKKVRRRTIYSLVAQGGHQGRPARCHRRYRLHLLYLRRS